MKKHKQEINIAWKKTWTLQRYKERNQEDDFDLKNNIWLNTWQMPPFIG
jgi:hypothetical protein